MGFETLGGDRPLVVRPDHEFHHLSLGFTNGEGDTLSEGQEVYLSDDNEVSKRDTGTQIPIGIVEKGGADGKRVTVGTVFLSTVKGLASGDLSAAAGTPVKPTGTLTGGQPVYAAVADGDYAQAIVIEGNTTGLEILVGILRSPIRVTEPV